MAHSMISTAWTGAPLPQAAHPLWTGLLLGSLLFLPGALGYLYEASSFASGTALSCAAALMLVALGQVPLSSRDAQIALAMAGAVGFIIIAHMLIALAIRSGAEFDLSRALLSLLLFGLVALSVPPICEALMISNNKIALIMRVICGLFILIAVLSLAKIQPYTQSLGDKPTFPYTEPSFFGFSVPAILIFNMVRTSLPIRVLLVLTFLGLGYALGNFTIIAACILAAATALPLSWVLIGGFAGVVGSASIDLSYYTERLNFDWANSTNLSALVYVQGWQMLEEALRNTFGWGLGFQQLGIGYTNVPASMRINMLLGRDANLQDGGFIFSKTGGEFGLLGLALIGVFFYFAARSFLKLRAASRSNVMISDGEIFARSCVVGYLIEMFVRGTNYFTGTFVLLLAALFYLFRYKNHNIASDIRV